MSSPEDTHFWADSCGIYQNHNLLPLDNKSKTKDNAKNNSHKIEKDHPIIARDSPIIARFESMELVFILYAVLFVYHNQREEHFKKQNKRNRQRDDWGYFVFLLLFYESCLILDTYIYSFSLLH